MATELPTGKVITAIEDAEFENYVAELLFSQGMNIVHRSVNLDSFAEAITHFQSDEQALAVFRSDGEFKEDVVKKLAEGVNVRAISLDGLPMNAHQIMLHLRSQTRLPLLQDRSAEDDSIESLSPSYQATAQTILVTGTSGSPGISSISIRLGHHLERLQSAELVDAHFHHPSLGYLCGSLGLRIPLTVLNAMERPTTLPQMRNRESLNRVVDLGPLPPMSDIADDRRWHSQFLNSAIDQCSLLIYVVPSSGLGLLRLERFIREFPTSLRSCRMIYMLNQSGNGKEDVAVRERFLSLTEGEEQGVLPKVSDVNKVLQTNSSNRSIKIGMDGFGREIARIAKSLAA